MLRPFRSAVWLSAFVLSMLAAAGCVSPPSADTDTRAAQASATQAAAWRGSDRPHLVAFGEPFQTSAGQIFVLRIQDQYRVIRCIPDGPIAGCYEDVLSVSNHDVEWNEWMTVADVPGLKVAFVSPTAIALFQGPADVAAASTDGAGAGASHEGEAAGQGAAAAQSEGAPTLPPPK
jgi:hypothetical protein